MIGKDANIENLLFKKSFEALIQRLARPATNIFIANPRTPTVRKRIMKEYIMELMTLNKFIDGIMDPFKDVDEKEEKNLRHL